MSRLIKSALVVVLLALLTGLPLLADTPVGWRNDGRGQYPAASPPTQWSNDKNVLWKVALPGSSYGAPIIQGDRLWVVSDPAELVCIRPSDGKVLWQKSMGDVKASPRRQGRGGSLAGPLLQALDTDKDGLLSKKELLAGIDRLVKECDRDKTGSVDEKALTEGLGRLLPANPGRGRPGGRRGGRGAGMGGAAPIAAALLKDADRNEDGKLTTEELSAAAEKLFAEADKEKKGKLDEQAVSAVLTAKLPASGGGRPGRDFGGGGGGRGGRGGAGNTAATPVSDGKHVAVVFGNGVAAVTTLDGNRLWSRFIESSELGFGHASSPLLLGGKLIVHIKDLVALDVATGKEVWRVALPAAHASPVATRLSGQDVVISPSGAVVRASDGKVLTRGSRLSSQSSPVVDGDTIYLFGPKIEALRLEQKGGEVSVTSLWSKEGARERHHLPSPVVHDGLLYGVTTGGFLEVIEAKSGERVYRQRLGLNQVYSSVTRAGELLYVVDTSGKAVVFKTGRRFEQVAVNRLEGMGSCPVFEGNRLYLRGQNNLYCLGSK